MFKRIILIDNGFLIHRSIFAFRTSHMNVKYLYLQMLTAILKKLKYNPNYDLVIIANDSKLGSWRSRLVEEYKANRKEKRLSLESAEWWEEIFKEINEVLTTINKYTAWHVVEENYIEADDWIAVACRYYQHYDVVICSSDSDLEQLAVYPHVKIFSIISKKFKNVPNPIAVLHKKIVYGDKSDNITKDIGDIELRKKIFSLLELPLEIETKLRQVLSNLLPKRFEIYKIPYKSIQKKLKMLLEEKEG